MRLRFAWDRNSLTVDLTKTPDGAAEHPGTEYVPAAQVEQAERHSLGFTPEAPIRPEPEYRR